jgi:hypothetical protein
MKHPILSRIPLLRDYVDERFLEHRRRSSSTAGFATLIVAGGLFEYRYFANHIWNWDLLAIILTFAVVKTFLCFWYRHND